MDKLPPEALTNALRGLHNLSEQLGPGHPDYVNYLGAPCVRHSAIINTIREATDDPFIVHELRRLLVDKGYLSESHKTTRMRDKKVKFVRVTYIKDRAIRLALDAT